MAELESIEIMTENVDKKNPIETQLYDSMFKHYDEEYTIQNAVVNLYNSFRSPKGEHVSKLDLKKKVIEIFNDYLEENFINNNDIFKNWESLLQNFEYSNTDFLSWNTKLWNKLFKKAESS